MRLVLSGGGTGGHIYPALTLWRYVQAAEPGSQVLYIGTDRGLEKGIVGRTDIPFQVIDAAPLKREISLAFMKTVWTTWRGYLQAKRVLRTFRPEVVVGTGGYVTLPVIYAASGLKIPSVVWEGNAVPGLTNQLCAQRASAVAITFPGTQKAFSRALRVEVTGNPRASEVARIDAKAIAEARIQHHIDANKKLILCYAGSRGAETINQVMITVIQRMAERPGWQLMYVTGEKHFPEVMASVKEIPSNVRIVPFLHDMPAVLPQVAVAVTRAGSSTLAEISALGVPSILIPSPYVTANHQEENALRLVDKGAARMLREADLTADSLWRELIVVLEEGKGAAMRDAVSQLATVDAVDRLYQLVQSVRS